MKNLRFFPLVLLLCLLFSKAAPGAAALDAPALSAQAFLLVDLDSGVTLYERNAAQPRSPASLTKVMTILLALEAVERGEARLDDVVTAGADCRSGMRDDSSSVGLSAGEEMTLRDLLYCAAVASGNDACNVIASYLAGSIPAFVERMNTRAAELGCTATRFVDPNGLSSDNKTCAYDLYLITREGMNHAAFMELCDTGYYIVAATNLRGARELNSSNALISPNGIYGAGYLYAGAHGVKTGYTRAAGYCLISTAERDGMRLLAIVMGCDGPYLSNTETRYHFVDSAKLYDWAFEHFSVRTVVSADAALERVDVALASGDGQLDLLPARDLRFPLPNDAEPESVELRITLYEDGLTAPIEAGAVLGEVQVFYRESLLDTVELTAAWSVPRSVWAYLMHDFGHYYTDNGSYT